MEGVFASATVQIVGASPTYQLVPSSVSEEGVSAGAPEQLAVAIGPDHVGHLAVTENSRLDLEGQLPGVVVVEPWVSVEGGAVGEAHEESGCPERRHEVLECSPVGLSVTDEEHLPQIGSETLCVLLAADKGGGAAGGVPAGSPSPRSTPTRNISPAPETPEIPSNPLTPVLNLEPPSAGVAGVWLQQSVVPFTSSTGNHSVPSITSTNGGSTPSPPPSGSGGANRPAP